MERSVRLAVGRPELEALGYVVEYLVAHRQGPARTAELMRRVDVSAPQPSASVVQPTDGAAELGDGPINWMRLTGALPDPADAYLVATTFTDAMLEIPRAALIELVEQIGALDDAAHAEPSEPRLDTAQTLSERPRAPAVTEYDRLFGIFGRDAQVTAYISRVLAGGA